MLYIDVDLFILVGITKRQNIIYYFCENKQDYCHKEKKKQQILREFQNQTIWTLRYKRDINIFVSLFKENVASRQLYLSAVS